MKISLFVWLKGGGHGHREETRKTRRALRRAETDRWMKKTTFLSEKCLRRVQKIDVIYTHLIDVVNRPVEEQ